MQVVYMVEEIVEAGDMVGVYNKTEHVTCGQC